ncbi:MAG: DUF4402 domain-containing protein [Alphaproteobacteria bacterium]|nr:DUF4402 domain-containing protein [Alphaproteobacteria bacterium]
MKKYFLISAVAILAATNVNAAQYQGYATLTAGAEIKRANEITCTVLNFGTIIVKEDEYGEVYWNSDETIGYSGGVVSVDGAELAECSVPMGDDYTLTLDQSTLQFDEILVCSEDEKCLLAEIEAVGVDGKIGGFLHIDSDTPAGSYVGNVTVTTIYSDE